MFLYFFSWYISVFTSSRSHLFTLQLQFFLLAWRVPSPGWPLTFPFFQFSELHQCFVLCHWKVPIATENWLVKRQLILNIQLWGKQVCLSLALDLFLCLPFILNCVCSVNIHDACFNLYFAMWIIIIWQNLSHDDPL